MPKKKRFRKKNEKTPEIVIEPELKTDSDKKKETKMEKKESEENKHAVSGIPRSKFSFSKKNKNENEASKDSGANQAEKENKAKQASSSNKTVKRSSSLSLDEESRSKIPVGKFRTLQPRKKHMSASCSNFESRSMVLNPGMDDWRMSGLLQTIEKSNSMCSLNTSNNSASFDTPSKVLNDKSQPQEKEEAAVAVVEKREITTTSVEKPSNDEKCIQQLPKENQMEVRDVMTDVIPEESDGISPVEDKAVDVPVESDITDLNCAEQKTLLAQDVLNENDDSTVKKVEPNVTSEINNGQLLNVSSEESSKRELYELDDENTVIVQQLPDVMLEQHMDLPAEVHCSDWLVLNIIHPSSAIETC